MSGGKGPPRPHQQALAQPTRQVGSGGQVPLGVSGYVKPTKSDSSGEPHSEKKLLENLNDMFRPRVSVLCTNFLQIFYK